jgi:hypothetical protein
MNLKKKNKIEINAIETRENKNQTKSVIANRKYFCSLFENILLNDCDL